MQFTRSVVAGIALVALAARPAQAAELSTSDRLQDRREVAAGTRAYSVGFQDGRFYANGWHITGEMGGIMTPPLKLLDSLYLGVNDQWVGPATRFTSGWGYMRYALPPIDGIGLERTDVAPDGRRGALIGLKLTNPNKNRRRVNVMADAHSELMTQYPWGFSTVPIASDNAADSGSFANGSLVFRDTGVLPGETGNHSYTAIVGSDRAPVDGDAGPGHYGPFGQGRRCAGDQTPAPMPSQCDDGPFGRGTGGRLHYQVDVPGGGATTLWIAVAGSENSVAEARSELAALTADPARLLTEKKASREALARWSRVHLPGDRRLADALDWGKQNLADLTLTAENVQVRWTDQGRQFPAPSGTVPSMTWFGAGYPDYPWLFATDGEYTAFAGVALGQFETAKDHLRALRDVSEKLNPDTGVVVHEVVPDGSVWFGKDTRDPTTGRFNFNTDETVKFPSTVALVWRWTGDGGFMRDLYDFSRDNLHYVVEQLDEDRDLWPEGRGNVEREGMGDEKLDNAVYLIRGLYDLEAMAKATGHADDAAWAREQADKRAAAFEETWWMESEPQYGDSLIGDAPDNEQHWIGVIPMEAELYKDGEAVPGVATYLRGEQALAVRETPCYSGERPYNRGLFHTGCGGGPEGKGERSIFSLGNAVQAVGEGNYGRLGPDQQRRYTDANAETMFGEPALSEPAGAEGEPDEQPGAMPEILPSPDFDPSGPNDKNVLRCWTCRSMFMQAWGNYGTAWPVIHQQLGVAPALGTGRLDVVPQVPDGQPSVQGEDIRLGRGSADVLASHDGKRYTTTTDTSQAPVTTFRIGHALPRGSAVASVVLDGTAVTDYKRRETNRGLEVWVPAAPGVRHTLVVTAA